MKTVFRFLDRWMWFGSVFSMFALVGVVLLQVFARVALPQVPSWTEEASRLFFIWSVGFAAGPAVRERAYVDVDSFTTHLPAKVQLWLEILIELLLTAFCGVIAFESTKLVQAVGGQTSAALIWPMSVFYAAIWLQTIMMTLYFGRSVFQLIRDGKRHKEESGIKGGEAF